jgi:hypothetical protein
MTIESFIEKYRQEKISEEILNEFRELYNSLCVHKKTYYSLDIGKDKFVKCERIIYFKETEETE